MTRVGRVAALWFAALGAAAPAPPDARAGAMEKLALVSASDPKTWSAAECTASPSSERVKVGPSSWHWQVEVDYQTGEPNYPIGWPRINHGIPEGPLRDWSQWDFLHVWIYVATSREALPAEPAGLGLLTPDRAGGYNRALRELKKDAWVELDLPISAIPRHGDVRSLQFHIAEANYRHGDHLDFYLNDLSLVRFTQPALFDFAAENTVIFADTARLPVRFQLLGVTPGERATVTCELQRENRTVARLAAEATRGAQRILLDLAEQKLVPGNYELRASVGSAPAATASLRVVESPWRATP